MVGHTINCGKCGKELEIGNQGSETMIDVPCWYCNAINVVNRYKMTVKETQR